VDDGPAGPDSVRCSAFHLTRRLWLRRGRHHGMVEGGRVGRLVLSQAGGRLGRAGLGFACATKAVGGCYGA
jgi:hypothetical protein